MTRSAQTSLSTGQVGIWAPARGQYLRVGRLQLFLLLLTVCELILGGSGRAVTIGPATGRMIMFVVGLTVGCFALRRESLHLPSPVAIALLSGLSAMMLAVAIGFVHSYPTEFIFQDLKYSAYFLSLPFFLTTLRNQAAVRLVVKSIKWCSVALTLAYCAAQVAIAAGFLGVDTVREFAANTADFAPRLTPALNMVVPLNFQVFFYAGFIYLGIAVIFFACERSWKSKVLASFILLVLFCTLTRGFIVSLAGVALVHAVLNRSAMVRNLALLAGITAIVTASLIVSTDANRERTDSIRTKTTQAVIDQVTPESLLVGHGFGSGVPVESRLLWEQRKFRYIHMENAFMEVLHKQGCIGLAFYGAILVIVVRLYSRVHKVKACRTTALQFFLGTIYVYLVSLFDPYVTNSIGMGFVCISVAAMVTMERYARWMGALCTNLAGERGMQPQ